LLLQKFSRKELVVVESPAPQPAEQNSQTLTAVSQQNALGPEAPRLGICSLQNMHIRRALAKQTGNKAI